jgi:hypothetical protein
MKYRSGRRAEYRAGRQKKRDAYPPRMHGPKKTATTSKIAPGGKNSGTRTHPEKLRADRGRFLKLRADRGRPGIGNVSIFN